MKLTQIIDHIEQPQLVEARKYPRTFHMPYTLSSTADDKILKSDKAFINKEVVVTEKMDGENTGLSRSGIHARSLTGYNNPWQSMVKQKYYTIQHKIPPDIELYGENMFAKHSVEYDELSDVLFIFLIMRNEDTILSWEDTKQICEDIGLSTVPVIYEGPYKQMDIPESSFFGGQIEGFVVRNKARFKLEDWKDNLAKVVRKGHVQTDRHWTKNWKKSKINITNQ